MPGVGVEYGCRFNTVIVNRGTGCDRHTVHRASHGRGQGQARMKLESLKALGNRTHPNAFKMNNRERWHEVEPQEVAKER